MRRRDALPDPEVVHGLRELEAALAGEATADPDLALLVADVGAARPEPSAAFLASLDARVHAGFPREDDTPRRGAAAAAAARPPWHHRLRAPQVLAPALGTLAATALVVVLATGGGSGTGSDESASSSGSSSDEGASVMKTPAPSADRSGSASTPTPRPALQTTGPSAAAKAAPSPSTSSVPLPKIDQSTQRKVQRAADLTLTPEPDAVQDTADGVVRETQAAGGYVQRSNVEARDDGGNASFTLRIPSAQLDDALARLSKLAHVGALDQAATDITAQTASAADLLSDARAERQALLRALGKATTARQIASLKARIADNRSTIARRKGALDAQRRRADLATVQVTISGTGTAKQDDGGGAWTPRDALHDAGRVLEVVAGVTLIALAVLVPLAILAALGLLGGHAVRRRRREAALDATA